MSDTAATFAVTQAQSPGTTRAVARALPSIGYVQGTGGNFGATTPVSSQFASVRVTKGNLLVAAACWTPQSLAGMSIADTEGNVWQLACSLAAGAMGFAGAVWWTIAKGGDFNIVTLTPGGSGNGNVRLAAQEYTGVSALDQTSVNSGVGTTVSAGPLTTTHPEELIFAWMLSSSGPTAGGPGFTVRQTIGAFKTEDEIVPAAGTYTPTAPTASTSWMGWAASFYGSALVQFQAVVRRGGPATTLSASQSQLVTVQRARGARIAVTQAQSPKHSGNAARPRTVAQTQSPTRSVAVMGVRVVAQGVAAALSPAAASRTQLLSQAQSGSTGANADRGVGQTQSVTIIERAGEVITTLGVSQAQLGLRLASVPKGLAVTQAQAITRLAAIACVRALAQAAVAGYAASRVRAATLPLSQAQTFKLTRAIATLISVSSDQAAAVRLAQARTESATQAQALSATPLRARQWALGQGQGLTLTIARARWLALTLTQEQITQTQRQLVTAREQVQAQAGTFIGLTGGRGRIFTVATSQTAGRAGDITKQRAIAGGQHAALARSAVRGQSLSAAQNVTRAQVQVPTTLLLTQTQTVSFGGIHARYVAQDQDVTLGRVDATMASVTQGQVVGLVQTLRKGRLSATIITGPSAATEIGEETTITTVNNAKLSITVI